MNRTERRGLRYRGKPQTEITGFSREPSVFMAFDWARPSAIDIVVPPRNGTPNEYEESQRKLYWDWAQQELARTRAELDLEREYYAKKLNELQGLVKRLLEGDSR